jgi:hypothetical protein
MTKKWIQKAFKGHHKGALHRQLGIPLHEKIPMYILEHIIKSPLGHTDTINGHPVAVTPLLKKRANFLLNIDRTH